MQRLPHRRDQRRAGHAGRGDDRQVLGQRRQPQRLTHVLGADVQVTTLDVHQPQEGVGHRAAVRLVLVRLAHRRHRLQQPVVLAGHRRLVPLGHRDRTGDDGGQHVPDLTQLVVPAVGADHLDVVPGAVDVPRPQAQVGQPHVRHQVVRPAAQQPDVAERGLEVLRRAGQVAVQHPQLPAGGQRGRQSPVVADLLPRLDPGGHVPAHQLQVALVLRERQPDAAHGCPHPRVRRGHRGVHARRSGRAVPGEEQQHRPQHRRDLVQPLAPVQRGGDVQEPRLRLGQRQLVAGRREGRDHRHRLGHCEQRRILRARHRHRETHPARRVPAALAQHPVPGQPDREVDRRRGIARVAQVGQRGQDVVALGVEDVQGEELVPRAQPGVRDLGQPGVVVSVGDPRVVQLAGCVQPLGPVLPQRLQHPEPGAELVRLGHQDRLVDQRGEHVLDVGQLGAVARAGRQVDRPGLAAPPGRADGAHRLRGRPGAEQREVLGDLALERVHQVPAPLDHGAQRAVPRDRRALAAGQQPEPVGEPVGHLGDAEHPQPRRSQLDGQRQPVQPAHDPDDVRRGARVQLDRRSRGPRPVEQQPHRRHLAQLLDVQLGQVRRAHLRVVGRRDRQGQRGQRVDRLAVDAQRLAAGRDHPHLRGSDPAGPRPARPPPRSRARSCPAPAGTPTADSVSSTRVRASRCGRSPRRCSISRTSRTPIPSSTARAIESGSLTGASSANQTPSGIRSTQVAATSLASRVLPEPPAPTTVTSRVGVGPSSSSRRTRLASSSRPTKLVTAARRLVRGALLLLAAQHLQVLGLQHRRGVAAEGLGQEPPGLLVDHQRLGRPAELRSARSSAGRRGPRAAGWRRPAPRARPPRRRPARRAGRPRPGRPGPAAAARPAARRLPARPGRRRRPAPRRARAPGRPPEQVQRLLVRAAVQRLATGRRQPGEPDGVHVVRGEGQPVAGGRLLDQRGGRRGCGAAGRPATAARSPGRRGRRPARPPRSARVGRPRGRRPAPAARAAVAAAPRGRRRRARRRGPPAVPGSRSARPPVCQARRILEGACRCRLVVLFDVTVATRETTDDTTERISSQTGGRESGTATLDWRRLRGPLFTLAMIAVAICGVGQALGTVVAGQLAENASWRLVVVLAVCVVGAALCDTAGRSWWSIAVDRAEGVLRGDLLDAVMHQPLAGADRAGRRRGAGPRRRRHPRDRHPAAAERLAGAAGAAQRTPAAGRGRPDLVAGLAAAAAGGARGVPGDPPPAARADRAQGRRGDGLDGPRSRDGGGRRSPQRPADQPGPGLPGAPLRRALLDGAHQVPRRACSSSAG